MLHTIRTADLDIAYEAHGPADGTPVILLHGFPYDVRAFDEIAPRLAEAQCRVIVPYLRGYGATRFVSDETMRSGQQAAIGADALALMDALRIDRAVLGGFDWGGRAACVVATLWPERVIGLVTCGGNLVQDIVAMSKPAPPATEHRLWYQHYMQTERGREGIAEHRRDFCRLLWTLWSPTWTSATEAFERSAPSFDNPDFVDVAVHSYRHRLGNAAGDPQFDAIEATLARRPAITVPTIVLRGDADGVTPAGRSTNDDAATFPALVRSELLAGVGHNVPQEAPGAFGDAILEFVR